MLPINYVAAILGYDNSSNRCDLTSNAIKIQKLKKPILSPEKVPMQMSAWSLHIVMLPLNDRKWEHDGHYDLVKQKLKPTNEYVIKTFCPLGNENNRCITKEMLKSGSVLHDSLQHTKYNSRIDMGISILMLKINTCPSMKSKVKNVSVNQDKDTHDDYHTAFLAFDTAKNEILPYPPSTCEFYDGRNVCSHLLAFMLFIRCVQICEHDQCVFEIKMPENPIKLQSCITLIEHVVNYDYLKDHKKRKTIKNK